ncbi:MAG: hypothetical protein ACE15F_13305 [bacterium]
MKPFSPPYPFPRLHQKYRSGLIPILLILCWAYPVRKSSAQAMLFPLDIPPEVFSSPAISSATDPIGAAGSQDKSMNPAAPISTSKGKKKSTPTPAGRPDPAATPTATHTSTSTATPTVFPSPTPTATDTPTSPPPPAPTATSTATPTPTVTPTPTAEPTETPEPTATPTATPTPEADAGRNCAVWVWNEEEILVSEAAVQAFHDTCLLYQIRKVYFSTNQTVLNTPAMLELLPGMIAKLRASGIETSALVSSTRWFYSEYRYQLLNWIERVAALNRSYTEEARFAGLHLDIEPEAQSEWTGASPETRAAWIQMLAEMYAEARWKIAAENMEAALEADVAPYYVKYNSGAMDQLCGSVNQVSIMAYTKTTPDAILEYAAPVIALARGHNTRYSIGARTQDYSTAGGMNAVLWEINRRLRDDPLADWVSIHHYQNYIAFNQIMGPSITVE